MINNDALSSDESKDEPEFVASKFNEKLNNSMQPKASSNIKSILLDCFRNSSIPGNRFIGANNKSLVYKISWLVVLLFCIFLNLFAVHKVSKERMETSAELLTTEKMIPIWKIPFPAVTICPETKAKKDMLNITQLFHEFRNSSYFTDQTEKQKVRISAVTQLCDAHVFQNQEFSQHILGRECIEAMREIAMKKDEMMMFCKYRNDADFCDTIFHEILTDEGVCYTFNMLNASDIFRENIIHDDYTLISHDSVAHNWSLDNGYSIANVLELYPKRALAGEDNGLFVLLQQFEKDLDYICRGPVQGFKVIVHAPGSLPSFSKNYFRVPLEQETIASIKPSITSHSAALRSVSPNERQCFFNDERYLKFFKEYSEDNCELECLANYTMQKCGCVRFNMPRETGVKICGSDDISCSTNTTSYYIVEEASEELDSSTEGRYGQSKCNCLPACTTIHYDIGISQAYFNWRALFEAYENPMKEPLSQLSRLSVMFSDKHIKMTTRYKPDTKWTFWALFGGVWAICTGISILSIFEMIFYFVEKVLASRNEQKRQSMMSLETTECDKYRII